MSKEKSKVTEVALINVPLPVETDTYTVISHGEIIQKLENELNINGLVIDDIDYLTSSDGEIVLAHVYIKSENDDELGVAFTWQNSYNKRVKFGAGISAVILENRAVMMGTDGASWIRKHTGSANSEAYDIIEQLADAINENFEKIIKEKEEMKTIEISDADYGRLMGALYFEHDLITPTQASAVRKEWLKPSNSYTNKNTLWGLYKILMFGIEMGDIKHWVKLQQKLHHMFMVEFKLMMEEAGSIVSNDIENAFEEMTTGAQGEDGVTGPIDTGIAGPAGPEETAGAPWESSDTDIEEVEEIEEGCIGTNGLECNIQEEEVVVPAEVIDLDVNLEEEVEFEEVEEEIATAVKASDIDEEELPSKSVDLDTPQGEILNAAVMLGYEQDDCIEFLTTYYKEDLAKSVNLKLLRDWIDGGKPKETTKRAPEMIKELKAEAVIEDKPNIDIAEEATPVKTFKVQAMDCGHSDAIVDYWTANHFDPNASIEENLTNFTAWAPPVEGNSENKPLAKVEEKKEQDTTETISNPAKEIKEIPVKEEEVVEETLFVEEEVIEEEVPSMGDTFEEMVENDKTIQTIKNAQADMFTEVEEVEEQSDNNTLKSMIEGASKIEEKVEIIPPKEEVKAEVEVEENEVEEDPEGLFTLDIEVEEDILDVNDGLEIPEEVTKLAEAIESRMTDLYGKVKPYHYENLGAYINVTLDETLERFVVPVV